MQRRHLYGATFGVTGAVLAIVQVAHAIQQTDVPVAIIVDGVPFALLGLSLSFVGYWLATREEFEAELARIAAWAVGGTVLLAAVAALTLFSRQVATGTLERAVYVTADSLTVGAVAGTVVGLYDARSQRHRRELENERDRSEAFARKAADLNNYGRALAQATTVEEVSAYCIEGVSSLLGYDRTAFFEVDGEETSVVSSTLVDEEVDVARRVAREATDEESIIAIREDSDLPPPTDMLTIRLESTADRTGVLVAIRDDDETLTEEDEQLLQLLASHTSMVLDQIYRRNDEPAVD